MTNEARTTITPMIEYNIFLFAVSMIFSSPAAMMYWMPEITKPMMAIMPTTPNSQVSKFVKIALIPPEGFAKPVFVGITIPELFSALGAVPPVGVVVPFGAAPPVGVVVLPGAFVLLGAPVLALAEEAQ